MKNYHTTHISFKQDGILFEAYVRYSKCTVMYGEDMDGNRGEKRIEVELTNIYQLNSDGHDVGEEKFWDYKEEIIEAIEEEIDSL